MSDLEDIIEIAYQFLRWLIGTHENHFHCSGFVVMDKHLPDSTYLEQNTHILRSDIEEEGLHNPII
jgi:hypothetical protein